MPPPEPPELVVRDATAWRRWLERHHADHTDIDAPGAAAPVIAALRNSHDALRGLVEPLASDQLVMRSYAAEWSIAQVPGSTADTIPTVRMPGEAFYRLVYGRLDRAHTPPLGITDVDVDELRARFPGF